MNYIKRKYYVNAEINGSHEVHHEHCVHLPAPSSRKYLGEFYSNLAAVVEAIKTYPTADSCKACSMEDHRHIG